MFIRFILFAACMVITSVGIAQVQTGKASYYADKFEGSPTASGEKYRGSKMTAAHKTLPFGTKIKVTNLANNESVILEVNDRGPFVEGRILDVSKAAAEKLGFFNQGIADIKIEIVNAGDGKGDVLPVMQEHVSVDDREVYEMKISRIDPKGFGIQLGTYQELANLLKIVNNLSGKYKKRTLVQVKIINGVKFYSPLLSGFSSREKAEATLGDLKKDFPDAFILDMSKI
ncbi:MAG: septal ring lytic transglycosylase RlpA family protein [Flammeovirgaceae bacterium]